MAGGGRLRFLRVSLLKVFTIQIPILRRRGLGGSFVARFVSPVAGTSAWEHTSALDEEGYYW